MRAIADAPPFQSACARQFTLVWVFHLNRAGQKKIEISDSAAPNLVACPGSRALTVQSGWPRREIYTLVHQLQSTEKIGS
jgi:hypothetical protein